MSEFILLGVKVFGGRMLRIKLLRNLLVLSLVIAVLLPLYQYFLVHPSYKKLLIHETENEAVRYASYMAHNFGINGRALTREGLPENLGERLQLVEFDKQLIKLRIFSASGEIIFSTKPDELGQVNENSYFRKIVANGRVFSKVAQKDNQTAEGVITKLDVVETYVPFMAGESFAGAFEVYYDITESIASLNDLSRHSMSLIIIMSIGFLLAIIYALSRAYINFQERAAAELALQAANEALESRVEERTQELSSANELLSEQIAERTSAQIALANALEEIKVDREKLDGILSSVPDGVVVTDNALNVLHMNSVAEGFLGYSLKDAVGKSIANLSKDVNFVKKIGQRLNNEYGTRSFDFEVNAEDGRAPRVYSVRISQLSLNSSQNAGIVLLICDVTRERDIERMKSAFLGMAAHELNTPLTTIIGYTELLTSEETAAHFSKQQQEDYLKLVHDKALSLGGLIDDLLDISRIESGRQLAINYSELSLETLIKNVVDSSADHVNGHNIELNLPENGAKMLADQVRMEQVVEHLISNAIKYSPGGGDIRVTITDQGEMYHLVVEDQGIGMSQEQLAHVFDRFYRADSSDTAVQGVGLGMSIVRHVVLAHHGNIEVESELGNGTRVSIVLPKMPPASQELISHPFSS